MNKFSILYLFLFIFTSLGACSSSDGPEVNQSSDVLTVKNQTPISTNFIGNGAQWGGFEIIESWTGVNDFNDSDWMKLKERMDFMRPPFIRIMISAGWNYMDSGDVYNPVKATNAFHRMMQYCTDNNITVMFGEWGHVFLNNDKSQINETWLNYTVDYLDHLITDKGYTCIKYYNMINEPNGDWSTTKDDYNLWRNVVSEFITRLDAKGLGQLVKVAGPDIAVFGDATATDWITKSDNDFGDQMGLYDIHSYPTKSFVNGDNYLGVLKAYKNSIPANKQIVVGEIGLKYYDGDESLQADNMERINADPYSSDDSNMFVYDGFYGIDVSDAIVQTMMAGYSGALVWDIDDAMYNKSGANNGADYKKLKRWGFWNILGEEAFDSSKDEEIRPFYYPVSLLCRYFPKGADIMEVGLPNKKGLRAVAARVGENYTIAIVNSNFVTYSNIGLAADRNFPFNDVDMYTYLSKSDGGFTGEVDAKGLPVPKENGLSINLDGSYSFDIPGQSVIIFTSIQ